VQQIRKQTRLSRSTRHTHGTRGRSSLSFPRDYDQERCNNMRVGTFHSGCHVLTYSLHQTRVAISHRNFPLFSFSFRLIAPGDFFQ